MRNLFSGNRQAAPLGPPPEATAPPDVPQTETLQAVRARQCHKRRQFVMQMLRADKDRQVADAANRTEDAAAADQKRLQMTRAAEHLSAQIVIMERVMEEFGLATPLDEEHRAADAALDESRNAFHQSSADAHLVAQDTADHHEYINTMASPFMMPSDVYDEDEAMRDLDETAKLTGRTE